jgi:hypothetical protein
MYFNASNISETPCFGGANYSRWIKKTTNENIKIDINVKSGTKL